MNIKKFTLFLILIFMITGCAGDKTKDKVEIKENAIPVSTENVVRTSFNITFQTIGKVASSQMVPLYFSVPGIVDSIYVDAGDRVNEGEPLARLENEQYEAQYMLALSAYEKSRKDLESTKELYESNIVSRDQLDNASVGYNNARANYITAKKAFENSVLKAPFTGSVISRNLEVGAVVSPGGGNPLFVIGNMENLKVVVSVPESDIGMVNPGQSVNLVFKTFPGKKFKGTVKRISLATKTLSNSFDIEIDLKNRNGDLRLGLIADVEIILQRLNDVVVLPVDMIHESSGRNFIYTVENSRAVKIPVEIIHISGSKIVLKNTIPEGTKLIVKGHNDVMEGSLVETSNKGMELR